MTKKQRVEAMVIVGVIAVAALVLGFLITARCACGTGGEYGTAAATDRTMGR